MGGCVESAAASRSLKITWRGSRLPLARGEPARLADGARLSCHLASPEARPKPRTGLGSAWA
eukprot:8721160-Alexandrium_andersonii.AAC.1